MAGRVLKLVIFDCDGVLVDSEPLVNRIEAEFFTQAGVPMTPAQAREQFKGKTVEQVVRALEARLGEPLSLGFAYDWAMTTAEALTRELRAVAGVDCLIETLQAQGIAVCVASQSPLARVRLSLHVTALDRYFGEHVFTAGMVCNPKPAPDLFLYAAERMRASPRDTLVIEDSPTGVLAARSAGMRVFGYAADEDAAALQNAGAEIFYAMSDLRLDRGLLQNPA